MSISTPEKGWWKPLGKDEKLWVSIALVWMLLTFFMMPYWHYTAKQNPSSESYKILPAEYNKLTEDFIAKYKVGEEQGIAVVKPPAGSDVYLRGRMWNWTPILELEKGKTYRVHLSSVDLQHGVSILPLNINYMALPGYDYVLTITPTTSGDFRIICNEFCGIGHHAMVGKLVVK